MNLWLWLASQDALEVMYVTEWVIISNDLSNVTLVSDDTYWRFTDVTLESEKKLPSEKKLSNEKKVFSS